MKTLYGDLETFSTVPINHGTHAYAEKAEGMLFLYAIDDGPVHCWDLTTGAPMPADLAAALADPTVEQVWHNGGNFDRVILEKCTNLRVHVPVERIFDTMVCALAHSLPGGLDKLGPILGVPVDKQKLKEGKALINLFCKPRPKNQKLRRATRETHPAEWAQFIEYGKNDIEAMREVRRRLPTWNYRGPERRLWELDQRINDRGIAVDADLARAALESAARLQQVLADRTSKLTDDKVGSTTQRDALLRFLESTYGVIMPDLKGSTVESVLAANTDLPPAVVELLTIRGAATKTSIRKYQRLLDAVSSDGRLRGLLQFLGAMRTGRWSGRTFQPQNLTRVPKWVAKAYDFIVDAIKEGVVDLIYKDPMEALASVVRGALVAAEGKKLCVADLSNIEGRKLAWLAREEWKLQAFRDFDAGIGHDLYKLAYAKAFGIAPEDVDNDIQRQVGKVMELALGYQGGVGAFITFAAVYGIDLEDLADRAWSTISTEIKQQARDFMEWRYSEDKRTNLDWWLKKGVSKEDAEQNVADARSEVRYGLSEKAFIVCDSFKRLWRNAHPNIVAWWDELQNAARNAIRTPGVVFRARSVAFQRDGTWLRCRLPSGRYLCYPHPEVDEDSGQISYMGVNQYSRQWCRLKTYGGKLAENITQAAARDVLASSMQPAEDAGYEIVLTVHDEIIAETPDTPEFSHTHLAEIMATVPPWAKGLPLAAAGYDTHRYRKG